MTRDERSAGQIRVRQGAAAAATVTVVGGMLVVGGEPVSAATITVDSIADDGSGGLTFREAVEQANSTPGADQIVFDATLLGSTITLQAPTVKIYDDLSIVGLGQTQLTLTTTGGDVLYVYNAAALALSDITITGAGNHGIRTRNSGDLTVARSTITASNRSAIRFNSAGVDLAVLDSNLDGNIDDGIYIYNARNVTITDTSISESGSSGVYGSYYGQISGTVTLTRTDISDNDANGVQLYDVGGNVTIVDSTIDFNGGTGLSLNDVDGALSMSGTSVSDNSGSGVRVQRASSPTLSNVTITDNLSDGFLIDNTFYGPVAITDSVFSANLGDGANFASFYGDLDVSGSSFSYNFSEGLRLNDVYGAVTITSSDADGNANGAGLRVDQAQSVTLSTSSFDDNLHGVQLSVAVGDVSITDTTASNNAYYGIEIGLADASVTLQAATMSGNGRAGVDVTDVASSVIVSDSTFESNDGSGVYFTGVDGDVTFTNVTASNNERHGVYLTSTEGDIEISMSTLSDNLEAGAEIEGTGSSIVVSDSTVSGSGDEAVALNGSTGPVIVSNSTITGNGDGPTDAVIVAPDAVSLRLAHSTITGNGQAGATAPVIDVVDAAVTVDHSVITDNNAAPVFAASGTGTVAVTNSLTPVGSALGASNVESDAPLLGALGDNGGATPTMLPLEGSPVIDAGDPAIAAPPATDQRGAARVDAVIDIGAVEVRNGTLSVSDAEVAEDAGSVEVTVERTGPAESAASVDIVLTGDTATTTDDFGEPTPATLSWAAGEVGPKTVTIPIVDDADVEGDETFTVTLTGATIPVTDDVATVTITDDDEDVVEPPVDPGDAATSLAPARFVDTRDAGDTFDDEFEAEGKRAADSEYTVQVAGRGQVPADAKAVIINVAAVAAEDVGFITVHPCADPRPLASSLNFTPGVNLSNEIVAPLDDDGELCIYTSASAHLLVDVVGFVDADSPTVPVTPARFLDTRSAGATFDEADQGGGKTTAEGSVTLQVTDRGDVPADAAAVIVNVTAVGPTETGFVTVHPCADTPPNASSLNYVAGVNRANELVASVDDDGQICLFTSSSVHLLVDVVGYVPAGSTLNPITPARFLDTRAAGETIDGVAQRGGKQAAGTDVELQITGRPGVPDGASAVVVNVTVAAPEANGFVTAHPCVDPRPNTSSLNFVAGVNGANELIALLDDDGRICLYTSEAAHLIVDVVAYLE